jgi:endogenous inhibitor of DNA gyrase (YacG/DUF329 family)
VKRDDCPICGKPADPATKPFCGRGCKDRDLLQWLGEGYRLPGERAENDVRSGLDSDADAD